MAHIRKAHTRIKNNKVEEVKEHEVGGVKKSPYTSELFDNITDELEFLLSGYDHNTIEKQEFRAMASNKPDELTCLWKICNKKTTGREFTIINLICINIHTPVEIKNEIQTWVINNKGRI